MENINLNPHNWMTILTICGKLESLKLLKGDEVNDKMER